MKNQVLILSILFSANTYGAWSGQIIARDLSIPGLGRAGHIGLTMGRNLNVATDVWEVLNDKKVIQYNSIPNFLTKSQFWGSKRGICDTGFHMLEMTRVAAFQACLKSFYTISAGWSAGVGYVKNCQTVWVGKWRCDTFFNWIYYMGSHTLNNYNSWFSAPYKVFAEFEVWNQDGLPPPQRNPNVKYDEPKTIPLDKINVGIASKMNLSDFVASIGPNNTLEQIEKFWSFALSNKLSEQKRALIIEVLGSESKPNDIPKFINFYNSIKERSPTLKTEILKAIQNIYMSSFTIRNKQVEYLASNPHEKGMLKTFFRALLDTTLSSDEDIQTALRGYAYLSNKNEILAISDKVLLAYGREDIDPYVKIGLITDVLFRCNDLDEKILPLMVDDFIKNNNTELQERFNLFLGDALRENINRFTGETKKKIINYLEAIRYKFGTENGLNPNEKFTILARGSWLEALALIQSSSLDGATKYMNDFLAKLPIEEQRKYIMGLTNSKYLQKGFEKQPALSEFKSENPGFYNASVGSTMNSSDVPTYK